MKPLVLISGLPDGGAERITVSFLSRLARRGRSVELCTVTARHDGALARELDEAGAPRRDLAARRLADPAAFLRYVSLLRREHFDVVHAHGQDAWILAAAARPLSGVPLVLTRHVLEEPTAGWRQRLRARAALAAARRADALVAVSSTAARRLSELSGCPQERVRVLPNGIEVERFQRPDSFDLRLEARRALGRGPEDRLVLVPAVLRAGKGHDTLLAALPRLRHRVPRASLLFAGSGPEEPRLREMAAPLGDAVIFLGSRQDIPELMAAADVVALPSRAEALPTALMEAGAAGRPVVASRVGGVADVVDDGVTGLLVPPDAPRELAGALAMLLEDDVRAARMGEAGARRIAARFSLDAQIEATLGLWAEVQQSRSADAAS